MSKRIKGLGQTLRGFDVTDINSKGEVGCRVYGMISGKGWVYHAVIQTAVKVIRFSTVLQDEPKYYARIAKAAELLGFELESTGFNALWYELD